MNSKVSGNLRNEVWQHLYDVNRRSRYYTALSGKYQRKDTYIQILLIASATTGVVNFFASFSHWIDLTFGFFLGCAIVLDRALKYGQKSSVLLNTRSRYNRHKDQWEELWNDVQSGVINNEEVRLRVSYLAGEETYTTDEVSKVGISIDRELNKQCGTETYEFLRGRYARAR